MFEALRAFKADRGFTNTDNEVTMDALSAIKHEEINVVAFAQL